jgi:hypothetical protein
MFLPALEAYCKAEVCQPGLITRGLRKDIVKVNEINISGLIRKAVEGRGKITKI